MNMQNQKRSLSAYSGKKPTAGLSNNPYVNNIKPLIFKNQIMASQSQKNIKSPLTPNRKVEVKSRPNTGGSKSPNIRATPQMNYKDRSRFGNAKNDLNLSNLSNNSRIGLDKKNDRNFSATRVPNLNFSRLKPGTVQAKSVTPGGNLGPKTSRDPFRNKVSDLVNSKSNSRINDNSINNSVNDVKSVTNRSKNQTPQRNLTPTKVRQNFSKSPGPKQNFSMGNNILKKPTHKLNFPNSMNFSKVNVINNIANESKKNSIEQIEIQITNNTKQRIQPKSVSAGMNKHPFNITKPTFGNNFPSSNTFSVPKAIPNTNIVEESKIQPKEDTRDNKFSHENLVKNLDFRAMNTSPLVKKHPELKINKPTPNLKPTAIANKEEQSSPSKTMNKSSSEPKIEVVNAKVSTENTGSIIKTIKTMFDLTKTGYAGPGQKKTNQDNFFIHKNFNNNPNSIFFGVCDGHGVVGHEASQFLRETLPVYLDSELKKKKNTNFNKTIIDSFIQVNNKLCNETVIDTHFSGSTCVTVIYTPEKLVCANVGDSRAVLGRMVNGCWVSHDLSRDHKPSEKDECQRIIARRGRVEPFKDENGEFIGPARVWLKEDDIPGLAMSRSFGDQVAASVGCIPEPEIKEWKFTKDDMFLILASDGIWEFIESDECVNIIKDFYLKNDAQGACEYLLKESTRRWMKEEEVIDDITLILVFFN